MKRILGILIIVLVLYGLLLTFKVARTPGNHRNIEMRLAQYGILTLGVGILIISGGIDLSIGSVFCLAAVSFGLLLNARPSSVEKAFLALFLGGGSFCAGCLVLAQLWGRANTLPLRLLVLAAALVPPVGLTYLLLLKFRPLLLKARPPDRTASALPLILALAVVPPLALAYLLHRWLLKFRARSRVAAAVALTLEMGAAFGMVVLLYAAPLLLANWLRVRPEALAVLTVLGGGALVGMFHGVLITGLRLQPFIVTLCGLFIWRGLAYWLAMPNPLAIFQGLEPSSAGNVGIGEKSKDLKGLIALSSDSFDLHFLEGVPVLGWFQFVPYRLCLLLVVAGLLAVLLHASVYGRYLFAIGSNEQAARYAGIPCNRYKVMAYMLCSLLAALGGMLQLLEVQTASPSNTGSWFELFAITGAVLGGCSLRGGEGTILGILLGTAVLPLLRTLNNFSHLPSDIEHLVIGLALLIGTVADELLKRRAGRRG